MREEQNCAYERASLEVFGYEYLRTFQKEAFNVLSEGRNGLFVVPTGSGKTLTYAVPSLVDEGITLIISPLIALIRDQQMKFSQMNIRCGSFDSLQSMEEQENVWSQLISGELTHLIVSPERLSSKDFRDELRTVKIRLIAIDEAHCISQWGFGFRPEYRNLGVYLREFSDVQVIALTATATLETRKEIIETLELENPVEIYSPTIRENLEIGVSRYKKEDEQLSAVAESVSKSQGAGIVYAATRKKCMELFRRLQASGESVAVYHGGLTAAQRQMYQREFLSGKIRIMVATSAFGLGIDKADIRFVHHLGLPGSFEQYVQEIGRAGRDQKQANCQLFYGPKDYYIQKFMIEKEADMGLTGSRTELKFDKLRRIYDFVKCDDQANRMQMIETYFN